MKYDVEPTAETIERAAALLERTAKELRETANDMRKRGDLTYAAQAANTLANIWQNVRIDLLVTRPLRETMRDG